MTGPHPVRRSDVAVVGGGPAGAMCALALARGGARVTLLHRPRHHVSPIELVSGHARRVLESRLDQPLLPLAGGLEIVETVSLWGTSEPVSWPAISNPWGAGLAVSRAPFDQALIGAARDAGVVVLGDSDVTAARRQPDFWELAVRGTASGGTVESDFLVLATGWGGASLLHSLPAARPAQLALMARLTLQVPEEGHTLYIDREDKGWWYLLPHPEGGHFAGLCTGREAVARMPRPLRDSFLHELAGSRLLRDVLQTGVVVASPTGRPAGPRSYAAAVGSGWATVGDAAFVSNPLSGMGIEFAVESAAVVADALLGTRRESALAEYGQAVQDYAARHRQEGDYYDDVGRSPTAQ